ncbi:hypothetical protein SAMN05443575_0063 [Jatrophihabitans endophyticus]|uniref:Pyridoxamine 5'-phosphate oxidase N-terminal domain-containing protein n=1 Tax=Jatrophihabitans endophyticus TaxID=1206085 RepID=A0A1M5C0V8_9ACTN|nr:pyridoxamine 5'-phosphate oxidase family protein [Jatrophihabitans endophyticus]SHF48393.1 hypothetical protein SAMN05443575_0063 [Jatrophihabitans endophyticus]
MADDVEAPAPERPGSVGEHLLQDRYGTRERADRFYREQMLDSLTPRMAAFIAVQTQLVVATADPEGRPDVSVRFGEPGFVQMIDRHTLCWPELRGNGVMTTLGNLTTNPWAHLMFLDGDERIGLHVRGETRIVEAEQMAVEHPAVVAVPMSGRPPDRWVVLRLASSYVHCRKHFPRSDAPVEWGTDDVRAKGGDYFGARDTPSAWAPRPPRSRPAG